MSDLGNLFRRRVVNPSPQSSTPPAPVVAPARRRQPRTPQESPQPPVTARETPLPIAPPSPVFSPGENPLERKEQLQFTRIYDQDAHKLGEWKYYKDEFPPKSCALVLFTEEYGGHNGRVDVSLGFACDLHDHMMADLKMFGKDGLRFRFWQYVPIPPSVTERMAYVGNSDPALINSDR